MTDIFRKYRNFIEKILFPAILFLYPLLTVNQGLDVADSTYSLTNFQYFTSMEGTWMVATFLANAAGWLLMQLPFGETLLGIKFYTCLVQSATALTVWFGLKKRIPRPLLFTGEIIALGLCWCPSTILYNYLTYLLMTAGILFLYRGICGTADSMAGNGAGTLFCRRQAACFVAAGICLGANVAVRMPNVVQAAFILAVWYGIVITDRAKWGEAVAAGTEALATKGRCLPWRRLLETTGWCLLGYAVGFGIPFLVICIRYGAGAYPDMVGTMFAMTDQAADYKPTSMLTGMFGDYAQGMYWLIFAGICMAAGWLLFLAADKLAGKKSGSALFVTVRHKAYGFTGKKAGELICTGVYGALLLVLLRFYWGRGMFTFHYYEHDCRSMYYPTVLLLVVTVFLCMYCLVRKKAGQERKVFAALLLLQIFVTPLGSNTKLYPIINNLFLAVPFTLWTAYDLYVGGRVCSADGNSREKKEQPARSGPADVSRHQKAVWAVPFTILALFVLVQSVGFHGNFVFQDGIWGEPRDMRVKLPKKAAGVYTNRENGELLEELASFVQEEKQNGRAAITYGELPGLFYLLNLTPALSTAWPDLDSYRMAEYRRDLEALTHEIEAGEKLPLIIVSAPVAAYWSGDVEAMDWFGVDVEAMKADEKLRILGDWITHYGYTQCFGNARYVVYRK